MEQYTISTLIQLILKDYNLPVSFDIEPVLKKYENEKNKNYDAISKLQNIIPDEIKIKIKDVIEDKKIDAFEIIKLINIIKDLINFFDKNKNFLKDHVYDYLDILLTVLFNEFNVFKSVEANNAMVDLIISCLKTNFTVNLLTSLICCK